MRRFNSDLSDKSDKWKTPYLDIIAVGTIQFFLSLLILCYGVFLMQFVLRDLCSLKDGLWTALSFIAASKITNPWVKSYCKHLDNIRHKVHKRNIIVTVTLLFGDLLLLSFFTTATTLLIFYGIFGGIFSSIISVHLHFATSEAFKHHPQLFNILDFLMRSFSLLIMPHLILFLINLYGPTQAFLILGAIILNIIPACLLIKTKKYHQKERLCKFQTVDRLSIELVDLNPKQQVIKEPSSSSSDEDDEEQDEEAEEEEKEILNKEDDNDIKPAPVSSASVQKYYQNVGVKILPNIPEESDIEEDDDINEINYKRLSRISAILQEMNYNTPRRSSNFSVNNLFQPEETIDNVIEPETPVSDFIEPSQKKSGCFSINSSIVFDMKRKRRRLKSFCYRHFVKTIPRTLGTFYFYPALISSIITTTLSTVIFATAPYLMFLKNEYKNQTYPNTPEESTFLLTIIGFTWLFFLAGYPVFNKLSSLKTKALFLVGLSILGLSLFIVHQFRYDNFVLFSLTFGLGHGIISYAENVANENFFGESKWKLLYGALEICTGFFVILIYIVIYFSHLEIYELLYYAYCLYFFDVGLWIVAYIVKKMYIYYRNTGRYNVERYPDFDF